NAFKALDEAETARPGRVEEAKAAAVVAAARALGDAVNPARYPAPEAMNREAYFNESNPVWWAPEGYFVALALLALSLGCVAPPGRERTTQGSLGRGLYWAGMLGLGAGSGLEVLGFTLRVMISGWAPVTN